VRIAVDGRVLTLLPTGLALYTVNLLEHMTASSHHTWTVFSPGPVQADLGGCCNLNVQSGRLSHSSTILAWQQIVLPRLVTALRADLLWSPHHYLPALPGIPKVCTIHDLIWAVPGQRDMASSRRLAESVLMPLTVRRASRVIAVSEATKTELERRISSARGKVTVIHESLIPLPPASGIELSSLGITGDYVLFVGTKQPRKNLANLVEAFRRLPEDVLSHLQLVIAGAEWPRGAADLGLNPSSRAQIVQTGYVERSVLSALYEHATVFAMPSFIEGFGLPLLEAMAADLPILTSDRTAMPEVVGDAAVLVDPTNVDGIADGLLRLLTDDDLRKRLVELGRERLKAFSWKNAATQALEVLETAAGRKTG
jgi:glycosyltransferase involved in cell wall biosynthesis